MWKKAMDTKPGKLVVWTAKVSWRMAKPVVTYSKHNKIKAWIAAIAIFSFVWHTWNVNNWSDYVKPSITSTYISQGLTTDSITKSLAADENVLWNMNTVEKKKVSDYVLDKTQDWKYKVSSYKILNDDFLKELSAKKNIPIWDISVKLITPQDTLERHAIKNSKNPQKLTEFLWKVGESNIKKSFDDEFNTIIIYSIDSKDMITYKAQIEELSKYQMFSMNIR
jgi:hypothetical protein